MLLVVNFVGVALILFVIWWFWLANYTRKAATVGADHVINITVDNGVYQPAVIKVKVGQTIVLRFIRHADNPCAATVIFADFDCSAELPLHKPTDITLTPDTPGEYEFNCQMGMYRGKLIVE